jgi:NitT/TauT family transport system substrate-binding protein
MKKLFGSLAALAMLGAACLTAVPAAAQGKKLILATPGIPPIYAGVVAYVAEKEGFFKKYGADVEIRAFDTGTAAARAVLTGDIQIALAPTPLMVTQISNTDVPLVAIHGFPSPDWIVASTDPTKTNCKDMAGQSVGVDAVGAARSIALRTMLVGCPGVKIEDVKQVALSSNTAPAMIAGQLAFGVLHLDDIAVIEAQGKKVHTVLAMKQTNPTSHYLLTTVRQDKLKENRDAYVRVIAALIDAAKFMQDPKNADKVAEAASPTGLNKDIAKAALKQFLDIGFWAYDDDGMDQKKLESVAGDMKRVGSIQADKEAVKFGRLVDQSVWKDAKAMVK